MKPIYTHDGPCLQGYMDRARQGGAKVVARLLYTPHHGEVEVTKIGTLGALIYVQVVGDPRWHPVQFGQFGTDSTR